MSLKISLYFHKHIDVKDWKDFFKKYQWVGIGGRKKTCWERFHLVTVAIGTIFQLLKIPVPKEDRSSKQNKTNKWRKQKDLVLENIEQLFVCLHLKRWYFLREWEQGGEMPKMWWPFLFQRASNNILGRRPWLAAAFSSKVTPIPWVINFSHNSCGFCFSTSLQNYIIGILVCLLTGQPLFRSFLWLLLSQRRQNLSSGPRFELSKEKRIFCCEPDSKAHYFEVMAHLQFPIHSTHRATKLAG